MTPIGIELRNNNGTLVVELSLTLRQYRGLYRFADGKDGLNFPPRGLLGVDCVERIALALEYAFSNTNQAGRRDITRLRGEIALGNNAHPLGLRLVVTRGFEFNLGPIHLGHRYQEVEYISPEGEPYKVPARG